MKSLSMICRCTYVNNDYICLVPLWIVLIYAFLFIKFSTLSIYYFRISKTVKDMFVISQEIIHLQLNVHEIPDTFQEPRSNYFVNIISLRNSMRSVTISNFYITRFIGVTQSRTYGSK